MIVQPYLLNAKPYWTMKNTEFIFTCVRWRLLNGGWVEVKCTQDIPNETAEKANTATILIESKSEVIC